MVRYQKLRSHNQSLVRTQKTAQHSVNVAMSFHINKEINPLKSADTDTQSKFGLS
jgi:hypothetical protein